jgi:hypothetical protein
VVAAGLHFRHQVHPEREHHQYADLNAEGRQILLTYSTSGDGTHFTVISSTP